MRAVALVAIFSFFLSGCGPQAPIRLGYIGGLSGRVADLGEAGRNGALMAIEEVNAQGGLNGRLVELVIHDDEQDSTVAVKAVEAMVASRVDLLIGPMTSAMAEAVLPVITRVGMVAISPTVTASSISGKDDTLFKVAPSVEENTRRSAAFDHSRGARRVAVTFDLKNRAFSADWAAQYRRHFAALGGAVVAEVEFTSGDDASYGAAVKSLAAAEPDFLLFVASAVDTVRLTQLSRNLGMRQPVSTSTWAGTENLVQLGGRTVEGMTMPQFFNREARAPGYLAFAQAFRVRFKAEPGFASVAAYDATRAVFQAIVKRRDGQSLKESLLANGPYEGLQESWSFDRFGDAQRASRMTVVREGRFVVVD